MSLPLPGLIRSVCLADSLELFYDKKKFYVAKFGDRGTSSNFIRQ